MTPKKRAEFIAKVHEDLDKFFETFSKSDGGGWALVSKEDCIALDNLIYQICKAKFELDCDGDLPINWIIIDRTKYEPMHYFPLPYDHKLETTDEVLEYIDLAHVNLAMALRSADTATKILKDRRKEKRID